MNPAESADPGPAAWKGEGELGFTSITGNYTQSENMNAKLSGTLELDTWTHSASVRSIRAEKREKPSTDIVEFNGRSKKKFDEESYYFGKLRYEEDKFSGFDYEASLSFGAGSKFLEREKLLLDASIGLGYSNLKNSLTKDTDSEIIVTADLVFEYEISETATVKEVVAVERGRDNIYRKSDTTLTVRVEGNLAVKLGYLVKQKIDNSADTDKRDNITTVSLVYGF
jgi:putative salt-induced outer membrane protein